MFFTPTLLTQFLVLALLGVALALFIRNRLRYDVIALLVMLGVIATGVLTAEEVFANLGHPAIIIIASMFVMSEAFVRSGIVDVVVNKVTILHRHPLFALAVLVLLAMFLSAFVNNAGALAMTIPIAIHLARKSNTPITFFLLPLAFASHLGGFTTLIGTPRNLIISEFRAEATGTPFGMFDFFYVGGFIALLGSAFLIFIAWRLIPLRRNQIDTPILRAYTTEVTVGEDAKVVGLSCQAFETLCKHEIQVVSLHSSAGSTPASPDSIIPSNITLNIRGTVDALIQYTRQFHLTLTGMRAEERFVTNEDDYTTKEAMVPPYAKIIGSTWNDIPWQKRFGVNFIGIFRRDHTLTESLANTTLWPNDMLVLHGRTSTINETISALQLLPIAQPETSLGQRSSATLTSLLLVMAITIASANILPLEVIFLTTAILLLLLNLISLRQAYESIDQTVLILIAGMLTLGEALQASGAATSIGNLLLQLDTHVGAPFMLAIILASSMLLSDFMNTNAAAVIMAPIAIVTATSIGVSIDPFLMAVAVGASCAFLTPIGHESNTMVMRQGGYTFTDYFKVGLPLEIIIFSISIPAILYFWPL